MKRATLVERAERVATAKALCQEHSAAEAARRLAARYALSRAQAWRYIRAVNEDSSLARAEATASVHVRVPAALLVRVRARARQTGVSLGSLVTRALTRLLANDSH